MSPAKLRKQMRFAAARALSDSAFVARAALVREVQAKFVLRNRYTERGFRVVKARRAMLEARVGTDRDYLVDHVTGGRRRNRSIPTKAIRRRPEQRVTRKRWPRRLLEQTDKHFMLGRRSPGRSRLARALPARLRRMVEGGDRRLLFRRKRGKRKRGLKLLYVIPRHIRIRRRLDWNGIVVGEHAKTYKTAYKRRLAEALSTAR